MLSTQKTSTPLTPVPVVARVSIEKPLTSNGWATAAVDGDAVHPTGDWMVPLPCGDPVVCSTLNAAG